MPDAAKPYPLISDAIDRGSVQELSELFVRFPDFVTFSVPGFGNWLIYASQYGTQNIVRYLIDSGIDVNESSEDGDQYPSRLLLVLGTRKM